MRIAIKAKMLFDASVASALVLFGNPAVADTDTLKKIKDAGVITMGVRDGSGAMSFTTGPGKFTGFHVEICERVIADIKKLALIDRLEVRYQLVTPQNRIPLVQNGTVDIECGTTTNNATRQKDVAFAPTLYIEEVRIAVKVNSPIKSTSQLAGKTVAATTGSTSVQLLRRLKSDATELAAKDNSDGFLLLETGRAEAFVADGQILATLISKSKDPGQYKLLDEILSTEPIAIMLPKGDAAFKKAVDQSVVAMAKSGEVARIYDKWFLKPIPPQNVIVGLPASETTRAAWANPSDKPMEEYAAR